VRLTKLICTLGPSSQGRVAELIEAGMDVARINCSHGRREDHDRLLNAVRDAAGGRRIGVMADLSGPKVRLGEVDGGETALEAAARFVLRSEGPMPGTAEGASTTHPGLSADLEPGDRVLLADGAVELRVVDTAGGDVVTEVVRGGPVRSRAGVNVPSERLSLPAITPKDEEDLRWALDARVDMVAQSFVRRAHDVRALVALMGRPRPTLVAKIETRPAVEDAQAILATADAVMVARGDLGAETALEEIPVIQKQLVATANRAATPAVVATQMLESMTSAPRPTRAEAGDVAGAVFDGADAILLSGETAIGAYPVEAARTAARILEVTETAGRQLPPVGTGTGRPGARGAAAGSSRGGAGPPGRGDGRGVLHAERADRAAPLGRSPWRAGLRVLGRSPRRGTDDASARRDAAGDGGARGHRRHDRGDGRRPPAGGPGRGRRPRGDGGLLAGRPHAREPSEGPSGRFALRRTR
jgi:pyruvate kinase